MANQDLDAELNDFFERSLDHKLRSGMNREAAERAARMEVGSVPAVKDRVRDVEWFSVFGNLWQDIRFAFRLIAKNRSFSATVILALALGIGVNAVGFTLVNAAFLRGLPFDGGDRLFMLSWQTRADGRQSDPSYAQLLEWRGQGRRFTGIAGYRNAPFNISDDRVFPEQARGTWLTANAFALLRQAPLIGRDFTLDDERPGAAPVAIIGYDIWQNRYGADAAIVGTLLRINGQTATIVGVMPESMKFPDNTDVWAPFIPAVDESQSGRRISAVGRLADGVSVAEAKTELSGITQRLIAADPALGKEIAGANVETFVERFVGGAARPVLLTAMGAVFFVLLIACANVANLLLSRSTHRAREIAVRIALGASRWRIVRQLLVESVLLSVIGGSLGLVIATYGVQVFEASIQDPSRPFFIVFTVDYMVIGYVAGICLLTGILFGLTPALHVSKTNMNDVLKDGGRGSAGGRRARSLSGAMVVAELALTVVLLAGAGLMIRSFLNANGIDVGVPTAQLTTMQLQLAPAKYGTPESRLAFYDRLGARLSAVPGIEGIAVTSASPGFGSGQRRLALDSTAGTPVEELPVVTTVTITPEFFDVLRAPLRQGRPFNANDGAPGSEGVIINQQTASRFFPGDDAIGKRLQLQALGSQAGQPWHTIIGISPTIRHGSFQVSDPPPVVYVPERFDPSTAASLLVRSPLPAAALMETLRREVRALDPDQPIFSFRTLDQAIRENASIIGVFGTLFVVFAAIGLVLSAVGLYGVMAYSVAQRTQEIGVRMALGADAGQVAWLILRRGLTQLVIGLAIGLAAALAFSRALERALIQITPNDPVTFAGITIVLTVVSIVACLLPARRALRVDPITALRAE